MATVNLFDANINTGPAINSIAGLEEELVQLQNQFKSAEIGSEEWTRLGQAIQKTQGQLKTFEERFEGLGIEQKNAAIVDSFNVVAGSIGAVTGAMVALGFESESLEGVERKLLGIITVVSSLREVSNGLAAAQKTLVPAFTKAAAAARAFALANPFTAMLVAVTAVTAGVYALVKATEEEKKSAEELAEEYDKLAAINDRRIGNREREAELEAERIALIEGEVAGAEKTLQLAKDKLAQDEIDLIVFQSKQDEVESALGRLDEEISKKEKLLALAEREGFEETSYGQQREKYREQLNKLYTEREEFLQREVTLNQNIAKSENDILKAGDALDAARERRREENERKAKEATDKRDKAAEDLAKRAVKQLEDQRQATEDLIELYSELYPETRNSGAFEFATDLDKVNYELSLQLQLVESLTQNYEDLSDQLEELDFEDPVSFFSEEQLGVFKKLRDANKTQLELQLEDLRTTYLEDLTLFSDNEEVKTQLTEQYEKDRAELRRQYALQNAQAILGITSNFLNTIADINQQSLELQLLQAAGNQAAIDKINADALEKQKKLRIAQTLVTTAESILNGFNATSALPPPFNFIAGGILAAAYSALAAKTIQTIQSTTLEGGGGNIGGFNNIPGGGGGFSLPGGGGTQIPTSGGNILPGLPGGGRLGNPAGVGTVQAPIQAYVLASDVTNGQQAAAAIGNRRRLSGG